MSLLSSWFKILTICLNNWTLVRTRQNYLITPYFTQLKIMFIIIIRRTLLNLFINKGSKHEIFGKMLKDIGYNSSGNEILYNGESGEQLHMELFIGPCYYMRLKHMVKDKINYRAQGPRTVLTRQTVQGRANDGGLRIGEMERDCIIAHGATQFLKESMLKRGDEYFVAICNNTGTIAIYNESKKLIFLVLNIDNY